MKQLLSTVHPETYARINKSRWKNAKTHTHFLSHTHTHTHTHTHIYLERRICPNKYHKLFVFYNKHWVTVSSGNTNTQRLWVCVCVCVCVLRIRRRRQKNSAGSFIRPATSSVRDVCDKSQIRSKTEFPLCVRPRTPQLGLHVAAWQNVFQDKKHSDFTSLLRIYTLAAAV